MKKNLLFAILATGWATAAFSQQTFITPRAQYVQGKGVQAGKFEAAGIGAQLTHFKKPDSKIGFVATGEWQLSGMETKEIDITYGGRTAHTDVDYTSTLNKLMGGLIYVPLNGSFVSPYLAVQGGPIWYRTKFYINDPLDADWCKPESHRNAKISFAVAGNVESGIKVRLRKQPGRQMYAQAGVSYTLGTRSKYIKLDDDVDLENTQAYTSRFKMNNGTHEHVIGRMYHTKTSQVSYSVGVSWELW